MLKLKSNNKKINDKVWFRKSKKNLYSIAALLPLVDAELSDRPRPGVMLYSLATPQAEEIYQEVRKAKDEGIESIYIAGGPHPSARPSEVLEIFDYVVVGEGEEALPELIKVLFRDKDPKDVRGIAFNVDGKVRYTGPRPPADLDKFPPFGLGPKAPVEISRGCPNRCAYCQTPRLFGRRMRHRSIPLIVEYARRLKDMRFTSPNSLAYGSDGFRPRLEKVEALLKALSEVGRPIYFGTFPSEVRPEFVSDQALELLTRYCANRSLNIGGQSGSPKVLQAIGRGHDPGEVEEACERCLDHGVTPHVDLIFSLPMESSEDQEMTLHLAERIVARGGRVRAHLFMPLPGTPLENTRPATLDEKVDARLGRMALEGKLTGSWASRNKKD